MIEVSIYGTYGNGSVSIEKRYDIDPEAVRKEQDDNNIQTTIEYFLTGLVRSFFYGMDAVEDVYVSNHVSGAILHWEKISTDDSSEVETFVGFILAELLPSIALMGGKDAIAQSVAKFMIKDGDKMDDIIKYLESVGYANWFAKEWANALIIPM